METKNHRPNIITFREILIPRTETFIENQTSSLTRYTNYYVGLRHTKKSLQPIASPTLSINNNGLFGYFKELLFKKTGFIPRSFIKKLKTFDPILCHSHFGPDSVYALKITQELNIPLIVTFHGYDATTLHDPSSADSHKQKLYFKHKQDLINQASLFIAVSSFIREKLIAQGYPSEKIQIHNIGIDTAVFKPNPNIQREEIILFVGRLVEKKGCAYLIDALSKSNKNKVKLVIIGNGPLREELEKQALDASIDVLFLGHQTNHEVKKWMMKSKLLCVPSITASNGDSEGFGMVFAEAQALGTPVVSFKSGGIPESVKHLKTGLLAEEKDVHTLSEYIDRLLMDKQLWQQFSQAGEKRVKEIFDLKNQTKALEKIYSNIISQYFK